MRGPQPGQGDRRSPQAPDLSFSTPRTRARLAERCCLSVWPTRPMPGALQPRACGEPWPSCLQSRLLALLTGPGQFLSWTSIQKASLLLIVLLFSFQGCTWLCPGFTPGSVLKYHSWQAWGPAGGLQVPCPLSFHFGLRPTVFTRLSAEDPEETCFVFQFGVFGGGLFGATVGSAWGPLLAVLRDDSWQGLGNHTGVLILNPGQPRTRQMPYPLYYPSSPRKIYFDLETPW